MGIGSGFGKLLLFGEHAAVYGEPAVGVTLPLSVTVRIEPGEHGGRQTTGLDGDDTSRLLELFTFVDRLDLPVAIPRHLVVGIDSSVPRASGLGSSAALSTALVRALASGLDTNQIWGAANQIERFFHGTPSGIDTGLSILGGTQAIYPDPPNLPRAKSLPGMSLLFVVGTVPRESSTKRLVEAIGARMAAGDPVTAARIGRLGEIAESAIALLCEPRRSRLESVVRLVEEAHERLKALDLSTDLLETVMNRGMRLGALSGKLSGAGGGGAFFLIVPDRDAGHRCATQLASWAMKQSLPVRIHGLFALNDGVAVNLS